MCSCATGVQQALCGATTWLAAVRVLMVAPAGRTLYGQAVYRPQGFTLPRCILLAAALVIPALAILATVFLVPLFRRLCRGFAVVVYTGCRCGDFVFACVRGA